VFDPNQFWMLRVQEVTYAERRTADRQAGLLAHGLWQLGTAVARAMRWREAGSAAAHAEGRPSLDATDPLDNKGIAADSLRLALEDSGAALYAAALGGEPGWADPFGGPLAAALLAAEMTSLAARLNSRAAAVRALAVGALLDEFSAVAVATRLGVTRQTVHEMSRATTQRQFMTTAPWRQE
jgi:hypothetical protein